MKKSLSILQREIYNFIKQHRREFNREVFKRWGNRCSWRLFDTDPELGCEIDMMYKALEKLGFKKQFLLEDKDYIKVWLKYKKRFTNKYLGPRVLRRNGKFPEEQKTRAIAELVKRGFKHEQDAYVDRKTKWVVECHIAPLVWWEDFEDQKDAINILNKFGIPGHTGIKTYKKQ